MNNKKKVNFVILSQQLSLLYLLIIAKKVFGKGQRITICCNLTLPSELIITASVEEVLKKVGGKKAEFMLVIM